MPLLFAISFVALLLPAPAVAQGGGGGGGGEGSLYGDLIHILRSPQTGQPILQKRMIEYPEDVVAWGYCPIPVDVTGAEIPFADLSCDIHPDFLSLAVEVDYFGRLSGGRTREVNQRMHFDEIIETIHDSEIVTIDAAGRLQFGTGCTGIVCTTWKVLDSPMANLAFYRRVMKYGHIQTDPLEEDTNFHGDPVTGTVYHPALRAEDWAKFQGVTTVLLPAASASSCFTASAFTPACAMPQALSAEDFIRAASFLAGAADKTGKITTDLVHYLNRILRIPVATELSAAPVITVPALIRDENGVISPATEGLPAPANERFVDFTVASYYRNDRFNVTIPALQLTAPDTFTVNPAVPILDFLLLINGTALPLTAMQAFVANGNDALRAVEFIHNYEVPADLYIPAVPTTTTVAPVTVEYSATNRNVTLSAAIVNGTPVNGGAVLFRVEQADTTLVGAPVLSGTVVNGAASATFVLPANTAVQVLTITASYTGSAGFAPSTGTGTLTIALGAPPDLTVASPSAPEGTVTAGVLNFVLTLSRAFGATVTVDFATSDGTATSPADYVATSGTATFAPGTTSVTVPVTLVADAITEPNETVLLTLSGATNAVLVTTVASGQITDDDIADPASALDFNSDGFMDIVWQNLETRGLVFWSMDGYTMRDAGALAGGQLPPGQWEVRASADMNADGSPDLILQELVTGELEFWMMNGTSRVERLLVTHATDAAWRVVGAADFNNDGHVDLLFHHSTGGQILVWLMNRTALAEARAVTPPSVTDLDWQIVGAGDMNGDGNPDIVWQNRATGVVTSWLMNGTVMAAPGPFSVTQASGDWQLRGLADINGDGMVDLLWQDFVRGLAAAWLMSHLTVFEGGALVPSEVSLWQIGGSR